MGDRCKAKIAWKRAGVPRCSRVAVKGGLCSLHHPDHVRARVRRRRLKKAREGVLQLTLGWHDGDVDDDTLNAAVEAYVAYGGRDDDA